MHLGKHFSNICENLYSLRIAENLSLGKNMLEFNEKSLSLARSLSLFCLEFSEKCWKNKPVIYLQTFAVAISRPLGATSRVIFELKPLGVSIMGANGSQPWVGRSTAQWAETLMAIQPKLSGVRQTFPDVSLKESWASLDEREPRGHNRRMGKLDKFKRAAVRPWPPAAINKGSFGTRTNWCVLNKSCIQLTNILCGVVYKATLASLVLSEATLTWAAAAAAESKQKRQK